MTKPVYKIETLTGVTLDHTIERDAINLEWTETLTDAVGSFAFTLPGEAGGGYPYNDIALHDVVKIYMGYDEAPATANFIGYVTKIVGGLDSRGGFQREISGLSQGEILLRRHITNTAWDSTGASTIVTAIATALSLGTGDISSETDQEDIEVETESYFDLLRRVSDYWVDGSNQVKYDFYVDVDGDLYWHARPIRTTGVETLTVGENIIHYGVTRDISSVKNSILTYGKAALTNPTGSDGWTEATTGWTSDGTLTADTDKQVGTYSVKVAKNSTTSVYLDRSVTRFSCRWPKEYRTVKFWWKCTDSLAVPLSLSLHLYAPDSSNYFLYRIDLPQVDEWFHCSAPVGPDTPYGPYAGTVGSPDWETIDNTHFLLSAASSRNLEMFIDAFHFGNARFNSSASDATSQSNYGQRDLEVVDDALTSTSMCQQRAETLLYQLKDPPTYLTVTTPFNDNLLVGDRLSMTIAAEGISAANYDVYEVTHSFSAVQGALSKALMVNSADHRLTPLNTPADVLLKLGRGLKNVSMGVRTIV